MERRMALIIYIALPLGLGAAVDVFWMPPPDEVDLPDSTT
jgi:hypothetical protein